MQYAWFIWNIILLAVWLIIYLSLKNKESKKEMFIVSLWTSLLGLTEPIFVPAYWQPPSLFNLALKTGFDIESLLFSFGVGGLVVVLYEKIFSVQHQKISEGEKHHARHKYHLLALSTALAVFIVMLLWANLNPIYSAIIALILGGFATWYCRPDLKKKMIISAFIFLAFYFVYFLTLVIAYPGYVATVWNLEAISGILFLGIPLEELLFAFAFGFLWSSIYEHITWRRI